MTDLITLIDTHLESLAESDAERRRRLIAATWASDGRMIDPPLDGTGHDGITVMAEAMQAQFPGSRFRRCTVIDTHHGFARYGWELVAPDGSVALTGTDIAEVADEGRLARVVGFFGHMAAA